MELVFVPTLKSHVTLKWFVFRIDLYETKLKYPPLYIRFFYFFMSALNHKSLNWSTDWMIRPSSMIIKVAGWMVWRLLPSHYSHCYFNLTQFISYLPFHSGPNLSGKECGPVQTLLQLHPFLECLLALLLYIRGVL